MENPSRKNNPFKKATSVTEWTSPIPAERWNGARRDYPALQGFESLEKFKIAQMSELYASMEDHERVSLARLLGRGQKIELEIFIRTRGANPIFDPREEIEVPVGVAKADVVDLNQPATEEAHRAILDGDVVHILFQAGEATRFERGPFYNLKLLTAADQFKDQPEVLEWMSKISAAMKKAPEPVTKFLSDERLGVKQPVMIRAALRRVVQAEVDAGRLSEKESFC